MTHQPVVLMRKSLGEENEIEVAAKYFPVFESRTLCYENLVIPRYSCLPYYEELEADLFFRESYLLNTYRQHRWIANFEYYSTVKDFTPKTWSEREFLHASDDDGPFIVKGKTNSRKHNWKDMMFAKDKRTAVMVANDLYRDSLIGGQGIIFRKYVPLKTLEVGANELPFSMEYRLFFYKRKLLADGYYWSTAEDAENQVVPDKVIEFGKFLAVLVSKHTNFFVLDIAETQDDELILIEINDGSMSGLSECRADDLYRNLKKVLK